MLAKHSVINRVRTGVSTDRSLDSDQAALSLNDLISIDPEDLELQNDAYRHASMVQGDTTWQWQRPVKTTVACRVTLQSDADTLELLLFDEWFNRQAEPLDWRMLRGGSRLLAWSMTHEDLLNQLEHLTGRSLIATQVQTARESIAEMLTGDQGVSDDAGLSELGFCVRTRTDGPTVRGCLRAIR